jgi:hypothetical protein
MPDADTAITTTITPQPAPVVRATARKQFPVTPERRQKYIDALRATASHRAAARAATPNGYESSDPSQPGHAYSTWSKLRRSDPIFRAECDMAIMDALGELESEAFRRTKIPDTAPVINAKGELIGTRTSWMAANKLLQVVLARYSNEWVEKKSAQIQSTITLQQGDVDSGPRYSVVFDDLQQVLSEEELPIFMGFLTRIEEHRQLKRDQKQLPNSEGSS